MPLDVPPPRDSRFGSPLILSRVHWVRPELVAEVKYLTWTEDNLLRQVVYEGLREDKPAAEVRRAVAIPETRRTRRARLPGQSGPGPADGRRCPARRTYFTADAQAHARANLARCALAQFSAGPSPARAASSGPHRAAAMLFSPFLLILSRFEPPPAGLSLTMITHGPQERP